MAPTFPCARLQIMREQGAQRKLWSERGRRLGKAFPQSRKTPKGRAKAKRGKAFPQSRKIRISASQRAKAKAKRLLLLLGGMDQTGVTGMDHTGAAKSQVAGYAMADKEAARSRGCSRPPQSRLQTILESTTCSRTERLWRGAKTDFGDSVLSWNITEKAHLHRAPFRDRHKVLC